ncbi:MAG TPA: hypothetical protein VNW23_03850 [Opitutaceae bacterium]|jgi:hypothetical protein|nr:hypothetical protein [Opitutaceae bacterium]HXA14237.1 hypothetical protein [Opitutaceae bacterium]
MRANRLLGAALVEHNLVKIEHLEAANESLLEAITSGNRRKSSVLAILAYEMRVVKEEDVLQHIVETEGIGLVDLHNYEMPDDLRKSLDIDDCWATWTVPFDREENFHFVATAHHLSPAVRTYWQKKLDGHILWYATTLEVIADCLEKLDAERVQMAGLTQAAVGN